MPADRILDKLEHRRAPVGDELHALLEHDRVADRPGCGDGEMFGPIAGIECDEIGHLLAGNVGDLDQLTRFHLDGVRLARLDLTGANRNPAL